MYMQIKAMAEEALKLQNKNFMDETFKRIIQTCECQIQLDDSALLASAPSGFSADYKHVTYGAVLGEGVGVIGDDGHIVKTHGEAMEVQRKVAAALERAFKTPDAATDDSQDGDVTVGIVDSVESVDGGIVVRMVDALVDDEQKTAFDISAAMCERFQETVENSSIVTAAKVLKAKKGAAK